MAAKKAEHGEFMQPPTPALLTEQNAATGASPSTPTVRVTIPIKPYPGIDEPYLQSFELLRNNAYQAVFSLGRLANAFRFSQFLYYYRNLGSVLVAPTEFLSSCRICLDILDDETRSKIYLLLENFMTSQTSTSDQYVHDGFWLKDVDYRDLNRVPFFRHPLSENYHFNTRTDPGETLPTQERSDWLNCFEVLYKKLLNGRRHLAAWMLAGWKVDRLVRPEMDINLLAIDYHDPPPPSSGSESPFAFATTTRLFNESLVRCTAWGYMTNNPAYRNECAQLICSPLSTQSNQLELPQSLVEFETFVSNWVRLCAQEPQQANPISTRNRSLTFTNTDEAHKQELLNCAQGPKQDDPSSPPNRSLTVPNAQEDIKDESKGTPKCYGAGEDGLRRDAKIYELAKDGWTNIKIAPEIESLAVSENWEAINATHIPKRLEKYCAHTNKPMLSRRGGRPPVIPKTPKTP